MSSRFLVPREFMDHTSFLDSLDVTGVPQKCKANFGKPAGWGCETDD